MAKGGTRVGGKPKGYHAPATLDKLAAREFVRERVTAALGPLLKAQIANATGFHVLVSRDAKTGKFTPVEAESGVKDATEIWLVKPNVQAFTDLLNRAIDKPAEQLQEIKITSDVVDMSDAELEALVVALLAKLKA